MVVHVVLVLMLCCLVLALPVTSAENGKIAFSSLDSGFDRICFISKLIPRGDLACGLRVELGV